MDLTTQPKNIQQLIVFDQYQRYHHYKTCKISIDKKLKELLLIQSGDRKFVRITFDRKFFRHKNIIYISPTVNIPYSYVLILALADSSKTIFDVVQKGKVETAEEMNVRKQKCYNLLSKTSIDKSIYGDMAEVFGIPQVFDVEDNDITATDGLEVNDEHVGRELVDYEAVIPQFNEEALPTEEKQEESNGLGSSVDPVNGETDINDRRRSLRKRNRPCYSMLDDGPIDNVHNDGNVEDDTVERKKRRVDKKKPYTLPVMDAVVEAQNFNVINYIENGISKSRLFIFPSSDRSMCYVYFYDFNRKIYLCTKCNNGKCTPAVIEHDSNGTAFVKHRSNDHICEMRDYEPFKYKTDYEIRKPNYDFSGDINSYGVHQSLLLYTSTDKKEYYEFQWDNGQKMYKCVECCKKRNYIQACVCQDDDGEIYISVRNREHICMDSLMPYLASNEPSTNEIATFNPPDYQHVVRNSYRIKVPPLNTADSNQRQLVQGQSPISTLRHQRQHEKQKAQAEPPKEESHHQEPEPTKDTVTAESQSSNIQPRKRKPRIRKCQIINYESRIIRKPHYQLMEIQCRDKMVKKLFVFNSSDKSKCYIYTWSVSSKRYICHSCSGSGGKFSLFVSAKVLSDENGEEYIQLGPNDHKCQMKKFEYDDRC